jgi:hypothetical protein
MNGQSASLLALTLTFFSTPMCFAEGAAETSKETSRAEVEQCVAQHDSARQLRLGEQWQGARTAMNSCADERCPLAIAADCRAWLDELARLMPTLLVVVEGDALVARHSALRLEVDGASLELKDPPTPIELLPGAHRLSFQLPGELPVEKPFSLQKGEKNHIERIRFVPRASPPQSTSPVAARPVPAVSYWLSAGALAAFAGSAAFLVSGLTGHADARSICAPNCDSNVRNSIQARLLLADITGGAGLVLGGLAVYTYLRRPVVFTEAPPSGPALAANGQGVSLFWRGQF